MAKIDTAAQFETLRREIEGGDFRPVYILMGEEPFYPERLCALITDRVLQPHERDFNQTILYGADTSVDEIVSNCERYPMMSERVLVVVREAQALKKPEGLSVYRKPCRAGLSRTSAALAGPLSHRERCCWQSMPATTCARYP